MFNKLQQGKQLLKLRQQAKELQRQLEEIKHVEESKDIKVKVDGSQKLIYLKVDGQERDDIVNVINKATKAVQKKAAKKMMESGGGFPGLFGGT